MIVNKVVTNLARLELSMLMQAPVQCEFFEVREVAGNVLEGCVRDPRTPRHIEAHLGQGKIPAV